MKLFSTEASKAKIFMNKIVIDSLDNIETAAESFLEKKGAGNIIALYGQMGAGKTTFTKAICAVLGVVDDVGSPTFTIINEYLTASGEPLYHFDFYRIKNVAEALDTGIEEYLDSGCICILEWPEKIEQILPDDIVKVQISVQDDDKRILTF